MNKAEEKGYEAYPVSFYEGTTVDVNEMPRGVFIEGYHQAEKDLELGWEDMKRIIKYYQDIMAEKSRPFVRVEDYKEVLNRFKYWKEK